MEGAGSSVAETLDRRSTAELLSPLTGAEAGFEPATMTVLASNRTRLGAAAQYQLQETPRSLVLRSGQDGGQHAAPLTGIGPAGTWLTARQPHQGYSEASWGDRRESHPLRPGPQPGASTASASATVHPSGIEPATPGYQPSARPSSYGWVFPSPPAR